jgi:cell division protein FtsI (penicillin-binding protein 3)
MPDLRGMSAMDAISLLENMGMRVEIIGRGKVKRQSIAKGVKLNMKTKIVLNLS